MFVEALLGIAGAAAGSVSYVAAGIDPDVGWLRRNTFLPRHKRRRKRSAPPRMPPDPPATQDSEKDDLIAHLSRMCQARLAELTEAQRELQRLKRKPVNGPKWLQPGDRIDERSNAVFVRVPIHEYARAAKSGPRAYAEMVRNAYHRHYMQANRQITVMGCDPNPWLRAMTAQED